MFVVSIPAVFLTICHFSLYQKAQAVFFRKEEIFGESTEFYPNNSRVFFFFSGPHFYRISPHFLWHNRGRKSMTMIIKTLVCVLVFFGK